VFLRYGVAPESRSSRGERPHVQLRADGAWAMLLSCDSIDLSYSQRGLACQCMLLHNSGADTLATYRTIS
jgi:hypothetical protein